MKKQITHKLSVPHRKGKDVVQAGFYAKVETEGGNTFSFAIPYGRSLNVVNRGPERGEAPAWAVDALKKTDAYKAAVEKKQITITKVKAEEPKDANAGQIDGEQGGAKPPKDE